MIITIQGPNDGRPGCGTVEAEGHRFQFAGSASPHMPWHVQQAVSQYVNSGKTDGGSYRVVVVETE